MAVVDMVYIILLLQLGVQKKGVPSNASRRRHETRRAAATACAGSHDARAAKETDALHAVAHASTSSVTTDAQRAPRTYTPPRNGLFLFSVWGGPRAPDQGGGGPLNERSKPLRPAAGESMRR